MAPVNPGDVIANRAAISLAQAQRLVSSWLPPSPDAEAETGLNEEDDRLFTAEPELQGLGSKPTEDGDRLQEAAAKAEEAQLRSRLLGKRKRQNTQPVSLGKHAGHGGSKPRPLKTSGGVRREEDGSDDDEEVGRSGVGKVRRSDNPVASSQEHQPPKGSQRNVEIENERITSSGLGQQAPKAQSYLDEVLDAHNKRKRRKKKKGQKEGDTKVE